MWQRVWNLLTETFWRWWASDAFRLGAALAYYTVFSLAPIVVIAVAVAGFVFGREAAQEHFAREIGEVVGTKVGEAIVELSKSAEDTGAGVVATIVSVVLLLIGATSVFGQLQEALNVIWGVKPGPHQTWVTAVKKRVWSFSIVVCIGFLLMVSLVISAVLSALSGWTSTLPGGPMLWQAVNWVISFGMITVLFALVYKVLPDAKVAWSDVWIGAAVTALLFNIGKYLIGLYLGQNSTVSAYGAAGSLVVILLWVYYSSQILLFGAEFTFVYAKSKGKPIEPARDAVRRQETCAEKAVA